MSLDEAMLRRSVFVTGKGGVGKTAVAAALAKARAERGQRVLLIEIDHASPSLGQIYGVASGAEPVRIHKNIALVNLRWRDSLEAYLNESLPGKRAAGILLRFQVSRLFLEALPLAKESVILRALVRLHQEGRKDFDCMIVDLPASGHAIGLFSAARTLQRVFRVGTVVHKQANEIEELFGSDTSGLVLTAIPEEMSITETVETAAHFQELSFPPLLGVYLNRFPIEAPDPKYGAALESLSGRLVEGSRAAEAVAASRAELRSRRRADRALATLTVALGQVRPLPLLPLAGTKLVDGLAATMELA